MPASYAHIALASKTSSDLNNLSNLNNKISKALSYNLKFIELGSISPDLPALHYEEK